MKHYLLALGGAGSRVLESVIWSACAGTLSGADGQPVSQLHMLLMDTDRAEAYAARRAATFVHDEELTYRKSHENPSIKKIYDEFLGEPNGHISHHLLHTKYCI